jgi:putative hydrolase of the HAD superfamily
LSRHPITLLLFDLDDTLIPSSRLYQEALESLGIVQPEELARARPLIKDRLPQSHVSSHHRLLYLKEILEYRGDFSPRRLLEMTEAYEKALEGACAREWRDLRREELMLRLRQRYRLAVITNETTRTQAIKLRGIDPDARLFTRMTTSEEVGCEKPCPRIFHRAFEMNEVSAQQCLVIGDDLINDIEAARSLGCDTFWVREFDERRPSGAYASLNDLEGMLR